MSTHLPGFFGHFNFFLHHFVLAKLATSSIRVKGPLLSCLCICIFMGFDAVEIMQKFFSAVEHV